MKRTLIILLFFSNLIWAQTNSGTTYYKDKYGKVEVENGPYMLKITKINDSITGHVFSRTKDQQKIWTKSYLGEQPYGSWTKYDKKGKVEMTTDYNFALKYGEYMPEKAIRFSELGITIESDPNTQKIQRHIVNQFRYPEMAQEERIQGKVTVQFTIDENGDIGNLRILEGVHISLDTECFRIMDSLKKLDPYEKDGKKVMVHYTMPITFRLA